jgi:multidrug efflux pump subunit AcrA (membrane-fusion protein)
MRSDPIQDLAGCSEFRQTLAARPPWSVHVLVLLLVSGLGAAVAWAAVARANLIVRAAGRVRPVGEAHKVAIPVSGEALSASQGARVRRVLFKPGDTVRADQELIELDRQRLEIDLKKRQETVRALEEELVQLTRMRELKEALFAKTEERLAKQIQVAREAVARAEQVRERDVRIFQSEYDQAQKEADRLRGLQRNASQTEYLKAVTELRVAKEKLEKAHIPVDPGEPIKLEAELVQTQREHAVQRQELALKQDAKRAELKAAEADLENLRLLLKQATVRAPAAGVVTSGEIREGDLLEPGKPVVEIAEQKGFRFEALVSSEDRGRLHEGMPARIKLDAYHHLTYGTLAGTVTFIAPDSTVQDDGGKKRAVYRVEIEVQGDEVGRGDLRGQVKLGMAGQVDIVTGEESILRVLLKNLRQSISLG